MNKQEIAGMLADVYGAEALTMYFFDPQRGKRRRAELRDFFSIKTHFDLGTQGYSNSISNLCCSAQNSIASFRFEQDLFASCFYLLERPTSTCSANLEEQ